MTESNPYLFDDNGVLKVTEQGRQLLESLVTDVTGNVYAFTSMADPVLVSAAMARLSRSPLDLRINFLREFAVAGPEQAEALFRRVITEYGDDSVKQLLTVSCVVENASNLLTKKLEWGRLAAYLEQSTRYIFFDQKIGGKYRYYTPSITDSNLRARYEQVMNDIFSTYAELVPQVTAYVRAKNPEPTEKVKRQAWLGATRAQALDAVRPLLPVATTSTVGIVASAQSLEKLIWLLSAEGSEECREVGINLLTQVRRIAAPFFESTDRPERGGYMVNYAMDIHRKMEDQASRLLKSDVDKTPVYLVDYWPLDEDDVISEMLFPYSTVPITEIKRQVKWWTRKERQDVFSAYMGNRLNRRNKPGRAIEKLHYEWEIVGDYGTFRDLQRHRMVDMWEWQKLSPDFGYQVPDLIREAGLEERFHSCFVDALMQ